VKLWQNIFFAAMETPIHITRTERVDDIPLLLAQMDKMNIAALLDKYFPMHGNWQELSLGETVVVWLAYILSEGDHRLNSAPGSARYRRRGESPDRTTPKGSARADRKKRS
jgi:hypothetical protein